MTESGAEAPTKPLSLRVVLAALAGIVPIVLIVQWSDLLVGGTMMAGPFPPLAACLLWTILLGLQLPLIRKGRRPLFNRSEMLVLLAVWITSNMVAGRGMLHPLLASIAGPVYYAKSGAMAKAIPGALPPWLSVTDGAAARGFFEGHGLQVPWQLWIPPLTTWALFFLPFLITSVSICMLFERIWVRNEKLAFPLAALPLEVVSLIEPGKDPEKALQRRLLGKALAVGMVFPILLHGFGVAHAYLPFVPCIPFFNDVSGIVTAAPWTAMRPLYVNIYPLLIGLTFLAPTDVTFSVWFFLLLNKLEMVIGGATGWTDGATGGGMTAAPPFLEEQSAGAYVALAAVLVFNARKHLARAVAAALGERLSSRLFRGRLEIGSSRVDAAELRWPLIGAVGGFAGLLYWCFKAGMPAWFATLFFGFYFAVALVLSRLMAEGGVSWILAPILPDKLILGLTGSAALSAQNITRLSLQVQHLRDTRQMIAPAIMQTGKMRDEARVSVSGFYSLLLVGLCVTLVIGTLVSLPLFYGHGALTLAPNSDGLQMSANVVPLTGVNQASARLSRNIPASAGAAGGLCFGALTTFALSALRLRFSWWPLHPLGYALTGTLQLGYANKMLFSIVLGWLFKSITLRFAGAKGYKYLRGTALGLICGDLLMGGVLKLLDALLGPSGYAIF